MTTLHTALNANLPPSGDHPPRTSAVISWRLAPGALRAARPDLGIPPAAKTLSLRWTITLPATLDRPSSQTNEASLSLAHPVALRAGGTHPVRSDVTSPVETGVAADGASAAAILLLDEKPLAFALTAEHLVAEVETDEARGLTHIRVAGLLDASLDSATGRVLYARTTLVAALRLPGGTYRLQSERP